MIGVFRTQESYRTAIEGSSIEVATVGIATGLPAHRCKVDLARTLVYMQEFDNQPRTVGNLSFETAASLLRAAARCPPSQSS